MALKIDAANEHAYTTAIPWTGGSFTVAFWVRRNGVVNARRHFLMMDTDDASPEGSADPRVILETDTNNKPIAQYTGAGGNTSDLHATAVATSGWSHMAATFTGSGTTLTAVEVFLDATSSGSPGSGSRNLSTNGTMDRIQIGSNTSTFTNSDIAHFCYFDSVLSGSQITELQTKLPSAITGATPVIYCPFLADALNDGSGGATYDFTLSGATIDSTNDGTLPALSGGGGGSTLTADQGSLTLTGQDAVLRATRVLTAEYGTYALTGQTAVLQKDTPGVFTLTAEHGTYSWNGSDALADYAMNAEYGIYNISGQGITLTQGFPLAYSLIADFGSYTLTGRRANLLGPGDLPTLGDGDKYVKLALMGYTGSLNSMLLKYYQDNGATSDNLNEAEMQFLALQGATAFPLNNRRRQFYTSLGYEGALTDMEYTYWWNL